MENRENFAEQKTVSKLENCEKQQLQYDSMQSAVSSQILKNFLWFVIHAGKVAIQYDERGYFGFSFQATKY